jgi:hypothetical protein
LSLKIAFVGLVTKHPPKESTDAIRGFIWRIIAADRLAAVEGFVNSLTKDAAEIEDASVRITHSKPRHAALAGNRLLRFNLRRPIDTVGHTASHTARGASRLTSAATDTFAATANPNAGPLASGPTALIGATIPNAKVIGRNYLRNSNLFFSHN